MINPIPPQYMLAVKFCAAAVVVAGSFTAGVIVTGWRSDAEIAEILRKHSDEAKQALDREIAKRNQAMTLAEKATEEARNNEEALRAAVAASQRDRRLRDAAQSALDRQLSACAAAAANGSPAGSVPADRSDGDRLMQLLGGIEAAEGMLAEAAQRARNAGLLAEQLYEVNRQACQ